MPARSIKGRKGTPYKVPPKKKSKRSTKKEEEKVEEKVVVEISKDDSSSSDDDSSYNSDDDDSSSSEYSAEVEETVITPCKTPPPSKKKAAASSEESDDESYESESDEPEKDGSNSEESSDDEEEEDEEEEEVAAPKVGFTDNNASWLEPKKKKAQLMSSSDEDDDDNDEFEGDDNDDDSDEEDGDMLEIERQSKLLDKEMEIEEAEAEDEMRRTIAEHTSVFHLPTEEELEDETNRVMPPSELRERIDAILEVLAVFKDRREKDRARNDYVTQLSADMSELYGYLPELVDYFLAMWGPSETLEFLTASDQARPLVIRTNTLKVRRKDLAAALMKRGVNLDPLANWSKVGLKITDSPIPIGATPEYLCGHYILQSAASLCPVMALAPQPDERVLDMSAAPGGKTSHIAQLMRNTGILIANDLKPMRQKATMANLHRLGVKNVITCAYDGRKLGKMWKNKFNKLLLDAPCSGLGVISRDPSVKVQRTIKDVQRCSVLQKELILSAIDTLSYKKGGGIMVYSTCSIAVDENEEVVNYLLRKRDVKILPSGLDFGKPGFTRFQEKRYDQSLALTRRFYPHVHNMDGFYVARIQKISDRHLDDEEEVKKEEEENEAAAVSLDDDKDEEPQPMKDKDEVDWEARVQAEVAKQTNNPDSSAATKKSEPKVVVVSPKNIRVKKKKQKSKKKRPATAAAEEEAAKKTKLSKISTAPQFAERKQKKTSTNAKVTKPRRKKME